MWERLKTLQYASSYPRVQCAVCFCLKELEKTKTYLNFLYPIKNGSRLLLGVSSRSPESLVKKLLKFSRRDMKASGSVKAAAVVPPCGKAGGGGCLK